jgi:hypothetical protein
MRPWLSNRRAGAGIAAPGPDPEATNPDPIEAGPSAMKEVDDG